jgi:PQQ-dependent dehydrogenase (methanol/ethanol family)
MKPALLLACAALAGTVTLGFVLHRRATAPVVLPVHPVTEQRLRLADTSGEWLSYGRDLGNRRYAPFDQINRQTVRRVRPLWHEGGVHLLKTYLRNESTPVVADGMLLYTDPGIRTGEPGNHVTAVDARTGRKLWAWYHRTTGGALCCGLVNRGVALYGDKVYVGTLDGHLVALDRASGREVWDRRVEGAEPSEGYSFTMAPLAAGGKIIIGTSGGEFRIAGFVDAYDPATGRRQWRFHTVRTPAEGGWWGRLTMTTPEGDPLPRDTAQERRDSASYADEWQRGGGPVWTTPSYDESLGLLIFGIGNPSQVEGRTPPGDNLYTSSIAAVEVATGKLRWYYQIVPHDVWDYDPASPPILIDLVEGQDTVPAVAEAGKTGWVYVLDRRTGQRLRRSEPLIPLERVFAGPTAEGVRTSPGTHGGTNWPSAAYSPRTGAMYVVASYFPMLYRLDSTASAAADARVPGPDRHRFGVFTEVKRLERYGVVSAVDVATGRIRWQHKVEDPLMFGGALATAGGLVFFSEGAAIHALDAASGASVWRYPLGKGTLGPVISFMIDGQQRLAVASARGVSVFGLPRR